MVKVQINRDECTACGLCAEVCPQEYFRQPMESTFPEVVKEEGCIVCGHCVAVCPSDAVEHTDFPETTIRSLSEERLPSPESVMEVLRARRSIREFKEEPVDKELIEEIIEAARLAPSAVNCQSSEYVVITDRQVMRKIVESTVEFIARTVKALRNPIIRRIALLTAGDEVKGVMRILSDFERVLDGLSQGKDNVLHGAPAVILFHSNRSAVYADANAQLAIQNAALMATSLGIGAFYTGYVVAACKRERKIPNLINIPKDNGIHGGLALGWPRLNYKKWPDKRPAKIRWI